MADSKGNNALDAQIEARGMRVGNVIKVADAGLDTATTASTPIYSDSGSKLAAGGFPFVVPFIAGATNTASSVLSMEGSATNTANDLMHLTLVKGANATATIAGYYRVTVTDDAGVITTGDYYAPFYTLS